MRITKKCELNTPSLKFGYVTVKCGITNIICVISTSGRNLYTRYKAKISPAGEMTGF